MYISLQIMCPRVPRVNRDMLQNAGVIWAGGEVSEADCYTVFIHNLNTKTLCHRKFCTLNGLNDKGRFIGEQSTVCMVCLHCCFGPSGLSEEIHGNLFVTFKKRPTWCRLPAGRWRNLSWENQNYTNWVVLLCTNEHSLAGTVFILNCCMRYLTLHYTVPMNTDCLV
jgi:hypothetical protein